MVGYTWRTMAEHATVTLNTSPPKNPRVALFITCLSDQFYPQVGVAATKILEKLGCRVEFPVEQTCCGQPFSNNGFADESRVLARRMIKLFENYDYVVTPSGSCCAMVREQYHVLLHDDAEWAKPMAKLAAGTFEFVEFLDKVLKVDFSSFKLPVNHALTYHYTCHLRGLGVRDEGVKLLQQIGNVEYRAMEKMDQCCGFGGTFAVKYPAISGAIVDDKARCIAATKAPTVVCNDAGCTMNISGMCHRSGVETKVTHIAELIAEAMGIDINTW
jgi:L-lactate dehydrogenase complex protein LldE